MSLAQFLRIFWARRAIVLLATIGALLGAILVAETLPPKFEASSRVMLDIVKPDPITGEVIPNQFVRAYTKTQIELMRDYRVTGLVVDQLGWLNSPILLQQYQSRSGGEDLDFRRWLAQRVADSTSAGMLEGSNILEITNVSTSPDAAKVLADAVRKAYIDVSLAFRRESSARSADWFQIQAEKARKNLAAAEAAKTRYERETGIILQPDENDLETLRLQSLASQVPMPTISSPAMTGSVELAQIDASIAQAAQTLGPNHPDLVALRQKRALVAAQVGSMRAPTVTGPSGPSFEAQKSRVIGQRDKVEKLRQLQAEVDLRRDQFKSTASRAAQLRQESDIAETGLTVLGSAVAPEIPFFPNKPLIIFGSLGFGFALGTLLALLTELFARRVRGMEDLRDAVDAPILSVISAPRRRRRSPIEALLWAIGLPNLLRRSATA